MSHVRGPLYSVSCLNVFLPFLSVLLRYFGSKPVPNGSLKFQAKARTPSGMVWIRDAISRIPRSSFLFFWWRGDFWALCGPLVLTYNRLGRPLKPTSDRFEI